MDQNDKLKYTKASVRYDSHHARLRTGEGERKPDSYCYRWTDNVGKRHAVYARSLKELREKEEQIITDRHDGIRYDSELTVNKLFDLWAKLKRGIKGSTMSGYVSSYNRHVRLIFGNNRVRTLKKSDVRRFYNTLYDERNLRLSSIDGIHNVLHQVLQVAVDDNIIRANPASNALKELKMVNGSDAEKRVAMTAKQQQIFTEYLLKNDTYRHWYPIFYTMLNTGLRVGEITGLTWKDVDLENRIITVDHNLIYYKHLDNGKFQPDVHSPKTKAGVRTIPITKKVLEAIEMEKVLQKQSGLNCQSHIDGYSDFIFLNKYGKVHYQSTLNKALHRITRDCNYEILDNYYGDGIPTLLPPLSCHVLRHCFATRMVESGVEPNTLKGLLGHADITTTYNIYVTLTEETKVKDISKFEKYISSIIDPDLIDD